MKLELSEAALADLDRFAEFLHQRHPALATIVANAIIEKSALIERHPKAGRAIGGREEYRQVVLQVINAAYIFQYRYDGARLIMLRVFHGREDRE